MKISLFVCSVYNDVSRSGYIALNNWMMITNNLLEKIRMEAVLAKFEVLSWHMHRVTETTKNLCQDSLCPS
jgi:hypothetical protein